MLLLLLFGLLATSINALGERINGYVFDPTPLTWEVDIFNNGTMTNMTGTVEQVYDRIRDINPAFKPIVLDTTATRNLTARDFNPKDGHNNCGMNFMQQTGWWWARENAIQTGQAYLRAVPGQPWMDPGPGKCARVSCSWASAIWWCNDNTQRLTLTSFSEIADCIQTLIDDKDCIDNVAIMPPDVYMMVCGQHFTMANWNCVARKDSC